MDFSTKTRLKLRVAVCPFVASNSFENNLQHHRVVGVKRDADTLIAVPVILRQFLLLLPLDCTFSDLKSLTKDQYAKLYKSQPNYLPLKSVVLFKDSNYQSLVIQELHLKYLGKLKEFPEPLFRTVTNANTKIWAIP